MTYIIEKRFLERFKAIYTFYIVLINERLFHLIILKKIFDFSKTISYLKTNYKYFKLILTKSSIIF